MRSADVRLRGRSGPVPSRVIWPATAHEPRRLLLCLDAGPDRARDLCAATGRVVLAVASTDADELREVVRWVGAHAAELGARPGHVLIAAGTAAAVARALEARICRDGWPAVTVFHDLDEKETPHDLR
jgi:alkanesulfonate monooxygenase SsuD/methylene tetrahydromethanopterin reductase-like flavin-dependent oxidoreductase (luciferase family)